MAKEKDFKVRLSGGGLNQSVSPDVAQAIVALVLGGARASASLPLAGERGGGTREGASGSGGGEPHSVREFLNDYQPKRAPDQIATIALYLKTAKNLSRFTKAQLIESFEDALEPVPKNLARDLQWTARIGWIAPKSGEKNTYYLTGTGEAAVKGRFPSEVRKRTKQATATRRGRRRKKTAKAASP